jgi:PAS domain S-box-containing protein
MRIQRRLIGLVGFGILLILTIAVFSLLNMTSMFSLTTQAVSQVSVEFQNIWEIERQVEEMSRSSRRYASTSDLRFRKSFELSCTGATRMVDDIAKLNLSHREKELLSVISDDLDEIGKRSSRLFAVSDLRGRNRVLVQSLLSELDLTVAMITRDIDSYKEENANQLGAIMGKLQDIRTRINFLFFSILVTAVTFLAGFGLYIHRKVSIPLYELWDGTQAISQGNLDYQMKVYSESDIGRLGERFNDMANKLKRSYSELEQRLFDRTQEISALNSVALTLGQAGSLTTVLQNSLVMVLHSLTNMEPRGGIFLVEPDNKTLRLVVQQGLSAEFVEQEQTIRMGECLCGMVAQTGELMFAEQGCKDPRHSRKPGDSDHDHVHSHVIVPIKSRGVVLGVMFLYPTREFALQPSDVQLLDSIGAQLGMAIENFRFYGEVKESSEKFWDLFENARDILFTMDTEGHFTALNRSAERFLGFSKVELYGRSVMDFLTDDGVVIARQLLTGEMPGIRRMVELEVVKRDGSHAFVEMSARKMTRNRARIGYQLSARDVTEQKRLREMLVKAERVGAIGQVGVAVRHEINNPLTTVIGNIELLMERYEEKDKELVARLETILNNALRIAETVKRLEGIKKENTVDYLKGVKMTDLKEG